MTTRKPFKAGTRIFVSGMDTSFNETWEAAKVGRVQKYMLPMPDGYVPVRFDLGGSLLVHMSQIKVQP